VRVTNLKLPRTIPTIQAMHLNNLGFLLYRQGEYDEAIKNLKEPRSWMRVTTESGTISCLFS
jgi:Tfp pilus assembly protein PilF